MKIGVITDMHLGLRQYGLSEREEDFYIQYDKAIDAFLDAGVDIVIVGGDIFDQPRPSPKSLQVFNEGISQLIDAGIQVVGIVGNHTMIQSEDFITADELSQTLLGRNNYQLLSKDFQYVNEDEDISIMGLPYHFNYQYEEFINDVNALNEKAQELQFGTKILVLHQAFAEYCGFTGEDLSINDINIDYFDLVICGHIHDRKLIEMEGGSIYLQPGSIECSSIAEARDEEIEGKGVYIFESSDISIQSIADGFCRIPTDRKFYLADMVISKDEDVDEMEKEIMSELSGRNFSEPPILHLKVRDSTNSFQRIMEMTKRLKDTCLTVNFNYFDENPYEGVEIISSSDDIPSPKDILKIALNPMEDDEAKFGLDLYESLKDGKEVQKLLDDFFEKRYAERKESTDKREKEFEKMMKDIEEYEQYFENL